MTAIPDTDARARRNLWVLIAAQAVLGGQMPMIFIMAGLAGQSLAPNPCWATMPITAAVVALLDGSVRPDDPNVGKHLDQCLGCRGCETACPSGVPYGELLEATRASLVAHRPLPFVARLMLAVFSRAWALRSALALASTLPSGLMRGETL